MAKKKKEKDEMIHIDGAEEEKQEVYDDIMKAWYKNTHVYLDSDRVQILGRYLQDQEAKYNELLEQMQDLENKYDVFSGE